MFIEKLYRKSFKNLLKNFEFKPVKLRLRNWPCVISCPSGGVGKYVLKNFTEKVYRKRFRKFIEKLESNKNERKEFFPTSFDWFLIYYDLLTNLGLFYAYMLENCIHFCLCLHFVSLEGFLLGSTEYESVLNWSIWPLNETLIGNTTPGQSASGSNSNEMVPHPPHISKTNTSPSDAVWIKPRILFHPCYGLNSTTTVLLQGWFLALNTPRRLICH